MAGRNWFLAAVFAVAATIALPALAAGPTSPLAAQIIANPEDAEINLAYAREQEAMGELGRAFAAYERVSINHPENVEAQLGMQRVRRLLQPSVTRWTFDTGVGYESNPNQTYWDRNKEAQYFGRVKVLDERTFGWRWRTEASVDGLWHDNVTSLNFARATANIGPLIDISPEFTLYPSIGGAVTALDNSYYYGEVNAALQLEGSFSGAYQISRLRVGYRDFDKSYVSDDGFYVDWMGKFTFPKVLGPDGVLILSPTARWSGIDGISPADCCGYADRFEPGKYWEFGGRLEYIYAILDNVSVGANVDLNKRYYTYNLSDIPDVKRQDFSVAPGVSLILRNLVGPQTDIRFDYSYLWNESNTRDHQFFDNIARITLTVRR